MQPLTRDKLAANAYRTLGLSASASQAAIEGAARRMRIWPDARRIPPTPWDLSWLGPIDRSRTSIELAVSRLNEPASRLEERALWYHKAQPPQGQPNELAGDDGPPSEAPPADRHDATLCALHVAESFDPEANDTGRWRSAFDAVDALTRSASWVEWIGQVESDGQFEKRASIEEIGHVIRALPGALAAAMIPKAESALSRDDMPACAGILGILRTHIDSPGVAAACDRLIDRLEDHLFVACNEAEREIRAQLRTNRDNPSPFYQANFSATEPISIRYQQDIAPALNRLSTVAKGDANRLLRAKTRCAQVQAVIALGWEWSGFFVSAEQWLLAALELAGGSAFELAVRKDLLRVSPLAEEERERERAERERSSAQQENLWNRTWAGHPAAVPSITTSQNWAPSKPRPVKRPPAAKKSSARFAWIFVVIALRFIPWLMRDAQSDRTVELPVFHPVRRDDFSMPKIPSISNDPLVAAPEPPLFPDVPVRPTTGPVDFKNVLGETNREP